MSPFSSYVSEWRYQPTAPRSGGMLLLLQQQVLNEACGVVLVLARLPEVVRQPHEVTTVAADVHLVGRRPDVHHVRDVREARRLTCIIDKVAV